MGAYPTKESIASNFFADAKETTGESGAEGQPPSPSSGIEDSMDAADRYTSCNTGSYPISMLFYVL